MPSHRVHPAIQPFGRKSSEWLGVPADGFSRFHRIFRGRESHLILCSFFSTPRWVGFWPAQGCSRFCPPSGGKSFPETPEAGLPISPKEVSRIPGTSTCEGCQGLPPLTQSVFYTPWHLCGKSEVATKDRVTRWGKRVQRGQIVWVRF